MLARVAGSLTAGSLGCEDQLAPLPKLQGRERPQGEARRTMTSGKADREGARPSRTAERGNA